MLELEEILVPVDFSPASEATLATAVSMARVDNVLQDDHGPVAGSPWRHLRLPRAMPMKPPVLAQMHDRAHAQLAALAATLLGGGFDIQTMVSEGAPFYEILRVAHELAVDAVVIGKKGIGGHPESVFFGSTAERVVRGCSLPVIVLPASS